MGTRTGVLLVGHDASRSGAPTAGLAWLQWARRHNTTNVAVLLAAGGPLLDDYRHVSPTKVVGSRLRTLASRSWPGPVPAPVAAPVDQFVAKLARTGHPTSRNPIVVANTSAAWALASRIRPRCRLVLWLHELDHTVERIVPPKQRQELLDQTDHIIAVGPAVANMVADRWQVAQDRITEVPSFVDQPASKPPRATGSHDLVAIGSLSARKAPDLFVAVAAQVARLRGHVNAAWVGGPLDGPMATMLRRDLADVAMDPAVDLPGDVAAPHQWLPAAGVVVHVAREDPAPLVVLEAAQHGVPVVTWAGTGAADLAAAAGRADLTVAPGDVAAMGRRVVTLLDDAADRSSAGRAMAAAAQHRTTEHVAPLLQSVIMGGCS